MARFRKHQIVYGDTMQSISQKETGDMSNWVDLVNYNDLQYPYIVDTREEKMTNLEHLVSYGDTIIIPMVSNLEETNVYKLNRQDKSFIEKTALGSELSMTYYPSHYHDQGTQDEILELAGDGKGDLRLVQGVENVKQATLVRLMTPIGSLILHPEYGSNLHNLFGKTTSEQMKIIDIEITSTVLKDTRIKECELVDHYIEYDTYVGSFKATLESLQEEFEFVLSGDSSSGIIIR